MRFAKNPKGGARRHWGIAHEKYFIYTLLTNILLYTRLTPVDSINDIYYFLTPGPKCIALV